MKMYVNIHLYRYIHSYTCVYINTCIQLQRDVTGEKTTWKLLVVCPPATSSLFVPARVPADHAFLCGQAFREL